jgi:CarboxypepD_reg-like domain
VRTIFILLLTIVLYCPTQAADILSRRIDVAFSNVPLKSALEAVAQKGAFEWSYNPALIPIERSIVFAASDRSVREVLYELLGDSYNFKVNGNYVIIVRAPKVRKEISGYLRDPASGERVANATIYDKRTLRAVTTDSSGYYQLKVKQRTEMVVSRIGYRSTTLEITPQTPHYQALTIENLPFQPKEPTLLQRANTVAYATAHGLQGFFNATLDRWHDLNVPDSLHRRFQVSLLPYVGTNHKLSGKVENNFSLNIIAGHADAVKVFELGGVANFTRKQVSGLQAAGVLNVVSGHCKGIQLAGAFNTVSDTLSGFQAAVMFNYAYATRGLTTQISGLFNISACDYGGIIQTAGMFNHAEYAKGAQVAGLFNRSRKVRGLQAAGLFNMTDELVGMQSAVIFNHARKVRGLQIGLINSSRDVKGLQIGLINRSGRRVLPFFNW